MYGLGIRGAIFDCDGTLVDSHAAHFRCLQDATTEQGFDMALEWYEARNGLDRRGILNAFREDVAASLDVEAAMDTSMSRFWLHAEMVQPIPEVVALFHALSDRELPLAVATNSEREVATLSLTSIGLIDKVHWLLSVSDGLPPKPATALFESAATLMQVAPRDIIVLEDSPQGLQAASMAHMSTLVVGAVGS